MQCIFLKVETINYLIIPLKIEFQLEVIYLVRVYW